MAKLPSETTTISGHTSDGDSSYGDSSYGDSNYGDSSYGDSSYGDCSYGDSIVWLSLDRGYILSTVVCLGFLSIVGLGANGLTCYGILRSQRPLSTQNILVLQLLFLNIVYCVYGMPVYMYDTYLPGEQLINPVCVMFASSMYVTFATHYFTLLLISLHRYFMVVHPHSKYLTFGGKRKTAVIRLSVFMITILMVVPPLTGVWGRFTFVKPWGICAMSPKGHYLSFRLFSIAGGFILPLISILYCYIRIIIVVRRQQKLINSTSKSDNKTTEKRRRQTLKLTFTSMVITALFIIAFLPGFLLIIFKKLDTVAGNAFSDIMRFAHILTDPLIYAFADEKLRRYFTWPLCKRTTADQTGTTA